MKRIDSAVLGCLMALVPATGRAQTIDQAGSLPISIQAQIGNTIQIKCDGPTAIPYAPASGSAKKLTCGDTVTIAGARGDSYLVRTADDSKGYVPASVFPTDPCVQTRFRSSQLRKEWIPKVDTMTKDVFLKFKNEIYLKVTPDDVSVAYQCISISMDQEQNLGGIAGLANNLVPNFNGSGPTPLSPDAEAKVMDFAETLNFHVEALNLLTYAATAQTYAYAARHDELLDRYNTLVDKHTVLINFVEQELHDLDSSLPPMPQPDTSPWRQILDGTTRALETITPPKHLDCETKADTSQYGNPFQPAFIYLNGNSASLVDCKEQ
jgi:hypothetical protein